MKSISDLKITGSYVIRRWRAGTKELISESPVIHNLVVSSSGGYGRNLIIRRLAGDATYGIAINSGAIGSGTTAPTDSDTGLETSVLAGILVVNSSVSNDSVVITFFIPDGDLTDGTYNEFGMFIGGRLFARSIISPAHVKGAGEDTTVDYTLRIS